NLCVVAGLSAQKIKELAGQTDTSARQPYEDFYTNTISGGINEYWTQEKYHVHFRIESEKLSVSISDDTYAPRIPPRDRSDGFQWYLSFYSAVQSEVSSAHSVILLLDNPALELHFDGQRDIKRFLEEKMPVTTQVIFVTHSPAMIDPYNLEEVRKVELQPNLQGTKVSQLTLSAADGSDLLEPVRSAVGTNLVSSLVFNDFNILVEGAADKPILEGAFSLDLGDNAKRYLVNGSVAESKDGFIVRFYQRSGLPYVVYLDADSSGRDLAALLMMWGIPEKRIIKLEKIITPGELGFVGQDYELEDV